MSDLDDTLVNGNLTVDGTIKAKNIDITFDDETVKSILSAFSAINPSNYLQLGTPSSTTNVYSNMTGSNTMTGNYLIGLLNSSPTSYTNEAWSYTSPLHYDAVTYIKNNGYKFIMGTHHDHVAFNSSGTIASTYNGALDKYLLLVYPI